MTIIQDLGEYKRNRLWIKREDLIPFSFGGNKARKAKLFFDIIDNDYYDCVVTYGTANSNHCRVIANECARREMKCYIISPEGTDENTFNHRMMELFGAEITYVPVEKVHETIDKKLEDLIDKGKTPFFIEGGGHGNIGTKAYVNCFREIKTQEKELGVSFDYIFVASGTGTTQAGLICGQLLENDNKKIIGISIARKNPRGREVVLDSIRSYMDDSTMEDLIQQKTIFIDDYTTGYGVIDNKVEETMYSVLRKYGIPLDATYTGKAFYGMNEYLTENDISGKNILFIHTGGIPLFFDGLYKYKRYC